MGIRPSWHQIHDRNYGSANSGASMLALCSLRLKCRSRSNEWFSGYSHRTVHHLDEILYDHMYKDAVERHMSKLEPEVEFHHQGAILGAHLSH